MLLLRPTKKVLNIARIVPDNDEEGLSDPGKLNEWFVDLIGLGKPGKNALLFVHKTTYLCIIVPGKSLEKAIPVFRGRLERILLKIKVPFEKIDGIIGTFEPVLSARPTTGKRWVS